MISRDKNQDQEVDKRNIIRETTQMTRGIEIITIKTKEEEGMLQEITKTITMIGTTIRIIRCKKRIQITPIILGINIELFVIICCTSLFLLF